MTAIKGYDIPYDEEERQEEIIGSWDYVYVGDTQVEKQMHFEAKISFYVDDDGNKTDVHVLEVYPEDKDLWNIYCEDFGKDAIAEVVADELGCNYKDVTSQL